MKKNVFLNLIVLLCLISLPTTAQEQEINENIDAWHQAAGKADFQAYFELMTKDATFIGTDANENWTVQEFKDFSKPYFDKGKAWDFKVLERNVFMSQNKYFAWFDELLDTHMGVCRGSGVLKKSEGSWKIQHYVLSITIPNDDVEAVTKMKADFDKKLISELQK